MESARRRSSLNPGALRRKSSIKKELILQIQPPTDNSNGITRFESISDGDAEVENDKLHLNQENNRRARSLSTSRNSSPFLFDMV